MFDCLPGFMSPCPIFHRRRLPNKVKGYGKIQHPLKGREVSSFTDVMTSISAIYGGTI